ncbi:MAG: hypothetical protein JW748_06395 [Anaerolineales bacterium]|nr:hypothetical protein [Anaerolineales bacterium]
MLTLLHALQDETPDHWRVIAEAWGVEYPASARDPLPEMIAGILKPERMAAFYRALPESSRDAIGVLRRSGGKLPVADFFHRYGDIRSMGPARKQREQPWRNPVSIAESLWYSGWLGRAFIRAGGRAQEYVFLPADLEALIPAGDTDAPQAWSLLSYQPDRREAFYQAGVRAAEDACTMLAYARNWPPPSWKDAARWFPKEPLDRHIKEPASVPLLHRLLAEKGLLQGDPLQPSPESARAFLEDAPEEAAAGLIGAWNDSPGWNDLARAGGLHAEGEWPNDPVRARREFLDALRTAPRGEWCTVESAVTLVRESRMEFLRPASEFDVWQLRDETGEFLRGIDSWDRVEGALVRYFISGPMAWLGAVDLAPRADPKAFRLTPLAETLFGGKSAAGAPAGIRARIRQDGSLVILPGTPLLLRYQLARCADWLPPKGGAYVYRISPRSLSRAREQGVRAAHIQPLLDSLAGRASGALRKAVQRWEQRGTEAAVRPGKIVLPRNPEAAKELAALAERDRGTLIRLDGPVYVVTRLGSNKLRTRLIEEGFLLEEEEET